MKKFFFYLLLLVISFSGLPVLQLSLLAVMVPLTCYVTRMSLGAYLKWYLHASIFILISLLTFVITYHSQADSFFVSIPFWGGYLGVNQENLSQAGFILLRIYCSLVSTYFFALTVPFVQMVQLFKQMRMPVILLEMVVLMYRFIFLVMYEFLTIRDTLDLKFAFYYRRRKYKAWGMLANTLFSKLLSDNERLNEVLTLKFDADHKEN